MKKISFISIRVILALLILQIIRLLEITPPSQILFTTVRLYRVCLISSLHSMHPRVLFPILEAVFSPILLWIPPQQTPIEAVRLVSANTTPTHLSHRIALRRSRAVSNWLILVAKVKVPPIATGRVPIVKRGE